MAAVEKRNATSDALHSAYPAVAEGSFSQEIAELLRKLDQVDREGV